MTILAERELGAVRMPTRRAGCVDVGAAHPPGAGHGAFRTGAETGGRFHGGRARTSTGGNGRLRASCRAPAGRGIFRMRGGKACEPNAGRRWTQAGAVTVGRFHGGRAWAGTGGNGRLRVGCRAPAGRDQPSGADHGQADDPPPCGIQPGKHGCQRGRPSCIIGAGG